MGNGVKYLRAFQSSIHPLCSFREGISTLQLRENGEQSLELGDDDRETANSFRIFSEEVEEEEERKWKVKS